MLIYYTETAVAQNEDRAVLSEDHKNKMQVLTKHVKQIEQDKSLQVNVIGIR